VDHFLLKLSYKQLDKFKTGSNLLTISHQTSVSDPDLSNQDLDSIRLFISLESVFISLESGSGLTEGKSVENKLLSRVQQFGKFLMKQMCRILE